MTLPSSGALSLNDVRGEFGGPTSNVTVGTYYRNGTYVYNVTKNLGVPTSGQIDFADWYGTEGTGAYAKGTCSNATTGGKVSINHRGIDTVGLFTSAFGSWADSSVTVGSTARTVRTFTSNQTVASQTFNVDFNVSSSIMTGNFFQVFSTSALILDVEVTGGQMHNTTNERFSNSPPATCTFGPNSSQSSGVFQGMPSSGTILLQCNKGSFT